MENLLSIFNIAFHWFCLASIKYIKIRWIFHWCCKHEQLLWNKDFFLFYFMPSIMQALRLSLLINIILANGYYLITYSGTWIFNRKWWSKLYLNMLKLCILPIIMARWKLIWKIWLWLLSFRILNLMWIMQF